VTSLKATLREKDLQLHQNDTSTELSHLKQTLQEKESTLVKLQESVIKGDAAVRSLEQARKTLFLFFDLDVYTVFFFFFSAPLNRPLQR
jgi:hypothetical protein